MDKIYRQGKEVRKHLKANGSITPNYAYKYMGIYRLASRIHELRASGMEIKTVMWTTARGKRRTKYVLADK